MQTPDFNMRTREYTVEKFAVSVHLEKRRARWLRYPGRLWWLKGMPELRDPEWVRRVLTRYVRWRFRRQEPSGVCSTQGTLVGPTATEPPVVGVWVHAFRDVHPDDRDIAEAWIDRTEYHRLIVPVFEPIRWAAS